MKSFLSLLRPLEMGETMQTAEELYVVAPGETIPGPESRLPGSDHMLRAYFFKGETPFGSSW